MRQIPSVMSRYGRNVLAYDENDNYKCSGKCFIQPLRYKNKMYVEGIPTEIGNNASNYYLLIAPANFNIETLLPGGHLTEGKRRYHIDKAEKIYFKDEPVYTWAVIKEISDGEYPEYRHFTD